MKFAYKTYIRCAPPKCHGYTSACCQSVCEIFAQCSTSNFVQDITFHKGLLSLDTEVASARPRYVHQIESEQSVCTCIECAVVYVQTHLGTELHQALSGRGLSPLHDPTERHCARERTPPHPTCQPPSADSHAPWPHGLAPEPPPHGQICTPADQLTPCMLPGRQVCWGA